MSTEESRFGLVHRVLTAHRGLREYAILITERRSVFILQKQSRNVFLLRTEIVSGAWGKTVLQPKTLEDYSTAAIGSLESEPENFSIMHDSVTKLIIGIGGFFPVYHFSLSYAVDGRHESQVIYAVPLATYETVRVQRPREVVLHDYAESIFKLYRQVLTADRIDDADL